MTDRLIRAMDTLSDAIANILSWALPVMVLITCTVVGLRYLLDTGAIWLQESVMYLHATSFLLAIGWTLKEDRHVRVDIVHEQLRPALQAWIDLFGTTLFLVPTATALFWFSWSQMMRSWQVLETSPEVGGIPAVFLLKTLIPLAAVLLLLQGLTEGARRIQQLRRLRPTDPPDPPRGEG